MRTFTALVRIAALAASAILLPSAAWAQASIAGTVRDTSGAILPGVTVEAASPALIEKTRSVVSDGTGQFKVVDLRPGAYIVTFSLPGFNTVKREGIELTGTFIATVNVELRVGAVEETITVTGETPIVDVQTVKQQRVMNKDVVDAIPTGRKVTDLAVLIPGVTTNNVDVGGLSAANVPPVMTIHGSRAQDQRVTIGGLSVANLDGQGGFAVFVPNLSSTQEVVFDTSAASAESSQGGININVIPKEGGNLFSGTFFATATNSSFQGSNYTQDLKDRGLITPNRMKRIYDVNPGLGGPIVREKAWIFGAARWQSATNWVGGMYHNANLGKTTLPDAWLYAPDLSRPASARSYLQSYNGRITWQVNGRNKISVFNDNQSKCYDCPGAGATFAPEAAPTGQWWPVSSFRSAAWTNPLTSRILLEASMLNQFESWTLHGKPRYGSVADAALIPVVEQSTGIAYHAPRAVGAYGASFPSWKSERWVVRTAASYVTGAHAVKVGFQDTWGHLNWTVNDNAANLGYRFNNGVPNLITQHAMPFPVHSTLKADLGVYAQDQWTLRRLTLNIGARYDYFNNYFPEQHVGPGPLTPTRNTTFPRQSLTSWHDLTPRLGVAYDLFGNGKTALKGTANKYVAGAALSGVFGNAASPTARMAYSITRSWNDATFPVGDPRRSNYVPDCDLLNSAANGECGVMSDRNFGNTIPSLTYDPETLKGWGRRAYNWEFSGAVQQQVLSRMSVSVGYFRRIYGNFVTTDNRAVTPADFSAFSIVAPANPGLPGGGGYTIAGLFDVNGNRVGQVDNYLTFASNYGKQIEHWNGVDISVNARLGSGLQVAGGTSTGRTVTDNCAIVADLRELSPLAVPYCHQEIGFLTQLKGFATYTIPGIGVQTSATFQSVPGPQIVANYAAPSALIAASLGRPPSSGAANLTINLVAPGSAFGERLNQLDVRVAKVFRFGSRRATVNLDIFNATNGNAVLTENVNFASFRRPTSIVMARFARISGQFDF